MSTITLPNIRVSSDLTAKLKLKDGGVAIDWSTLTNIRVSIYSDAQKALAGRCSASIDEDDSTILVCQYAANKPQYVGVNRVVVSAKYMNETKTYDKPAFNFVRWTDDQEGQTITIDDPDIDVEISVEDISSSILQEAVDAANTAAERANEAAEAAEHMVDIHTGPQGPAGKSPYIDETTGDWFIYDDETGEYVDSGNQAKGDTGNGIASWSVVESEVDGGSNVVTVTFTNGDSETFTYKNGHTGATPNISIGTVTTGAAGSQAAATMTGTAAAPVLNLTIPKGDKGDQGNTGSSVDYPYELVNNCTTDDATKGLSAAQGVALKAELSQFEARIDGVRAFSYTVTKGQQYYTNGYERWNRYSYSGKLSAGVFNFKCPVEFYFAAAKYVSDSEGIVVLSYGQTERINWVIDAEWILSVKKVDGTELTTDDINTINSAGIVEQVVGSNIETMRTEIQTLQSGFAPLNLMYDSNKRGGFLCLGDSLTFGVGVINNITPIEDSRTYPKQLEEILGGKSYNGGVGGSSMTDNNFVDFPIVVDALTSGDYTELNTKLDALTGVNTLAKTRWIEIEALDISTLDFIAIAFGVNDWTISAPIHGETDTDILSVCGALRYGINKLRQAFPGVKLYVFTPTFAYMLGYGMAFNSDNYPNEERGLYLDEYCDAIEQLCNELNVPVKNMYYCSGIKASNAGSFYVDGKHRNAAGYKLLASQYAGLIKNN